MDAACEYFAGKTAIPADATSPIDGPTFCFSSGPAGRAAPLRPLLRLPVERKTASSTWARLIADIYEVDPLRCAECGSPTKVVAVIMDLVEVDKILAHLVKTGRAPPGLQSQQED